ncbi:MAG: polysaccharide biosynthesis protein [Oscillospiraceae bacterium]|jgi:stage V sporulation protein B|nr:polysaccharide biosynthesis protein [Oscillospiraceae bacterium]MCI8759093.1 polysaccharide biosynthesis protein [Oscillospiraceae bacterium]MCI9562666.1 polysaccharide biosynthesis protein [Oscillospiraceae bacterium]
MSREKKQSFMGGVTVMAVSTVFVKICGALYKIPLNNILGDEGVTHFMSAYNIYAFLLTLSTAGLPLALSKLISEANATGRRTQMRRCFNTAMALFVVLGIMGTAAMLLFTRQLAALMHNSMAYWPIKALGVSVVCVSIMCAYRGFAQGRQNMVPTAVSQFIEAFFKLVIGLPLAWYLIRSGQNLEIGAAGAIVGVSAGTVLAMVYMILNYRKNRGPILWGTDRPQSHGVIMRRLLGLGIPITIGQAGMSLLNLLDQTVILGQLQNVLGLAEREAAVLYGQYTFSSTLFNLPAAFLPAVAVSLIPAVSVAVARMDHREVNRVVTTSFRLIAMLAIPAGVGLSVLAGPILLLLYPARRETAIAATYHLQLLGFASIFVCVMLLTNSIMQAHGKVRLPIYTMLIGGAVKVGINYVLVGNPDVNIKGAPLGTLACYALIAVINLAIVHQLLEKKPNYLGIFAKPVLASAVMGAAAWAVHGLLSRVIAGGYLKESLCTFLTVCVAVAVYLILVIALRMVTREDLKMIPKGDKLARLLHIR